jgi:hypothetical protein
MVPITADVRCGSMAIARSAIHQRSLFTDTSRAYATPHESVNLEVLAPDRCSSSAPLRAALLATVQCGGSAGRRRRFFLPVWLGFTTKKSVGEIPGLFARLALALALLAGLLAGCGDGESSSAPPTKEPFPAPWQRTETREPCADFHPLRAPFFGDLHVHTRVSADATIFGTKVGPRDAYAFARGGTIAVSDADEQPTRSARLDRPLDFTAVTDHSEWFGEVRVCTTPGTPVYDDDICKVLRQAESPQRQLAATVRWLYPAGVNNPPPGLPFCMVPGVDCDGAAVSVWQDMQAAAEEAYDRTDACTFTSFIAYEHTPSLAGRHLHRNVIFRNEHVPPFAASQLDTASGGVPQGLWTAIERDCLDAGTGCDAVLIPHNSNLSSGLQFFDPADAAEAQRRHDREPLAEIHQQKGNSECRFDRLAGRGVGTVDELCTFEQLRGANETPSQPIPSIDDYPRRNLIRNALEDGLLFEEMLGVNPFQMGFVGSTDTHNATAGNTDEGEWVGAQGNNDATPARQIGDNLRNNPGGLTAVWAEENSRDALFAALRRRETYATSGTRPVVRFFAGALAGVRCGAADLVERAYRTGTPMGGEIGAVRGDASPHFAVLATKDPGTAAQPGTDLQRVQIVKGWVGADGQAHEKVFEVAGDAHNGAGVDPATCQPRGRGAAELCSVWEDPEFDRSQRAFYYLRLLENPTCRWSTLVCKAAGVDPFAPDCAAQATAAGDAFADCCLSRDADAFFDPVVQERAWSSPVWYRPEAIASVDGSVRFGAHAGADRLTLQIRIGALPGSVDPEHDELTVAVTDDDEIYRVTIPAGGLVRDATRPLFVLAANAGPDAPDALTLSLAANGEAELDLEAGARDLAAADRVDHIVEVSITIGDYHAVHTRLWQASGDRLQLVEDVLL